MESIGPYQVVRELGRGGMGAVYEVRHPSHSRPLALKLILPNFASGDAIVRFKREAEVMARAAHPGVVVVHDFGRAPQGPYIVSELVEGEPLDKRLKQGSIEPKVAAKILRGLADAMATVHSSGALHRDLKPANIMIRPDGSPVVLDFGLAQDESAEKLTQTGTMLGTPHYMSPEQVDGDLKVIGPPTDIYGLGAVLYAMLTNEAPFAGKTGLPLIRAVLSEPVPPVGTLAPDVPPGLEAICAKAMAPEIADRYPDAEALREDLDCFLRNRPVQAPLLKPSVPVGRIVAGLAVALLVVATAATFRASESPPDETPDPTPAKNRVDKGSARADAATLKSLAHDDWDALRARYWTLRKTFPNDPEIKRIFNAREELVKLVALGVPHDAAAAWRKAYGGLYVPEGLRRTYVASSISSPRRPRVFEELDSPNAGVVVTNDRVVSYAPTGKTGIESWDLNSSTRLTSMSKRVFPSAIPPFVDAKGDLLVFLAKDGGANAALRMTPSATKLFKLLSTDVPADMLPRSSPSAIAVSAERIAIGFDGGRIDIFDSNYTYKSTLPERHHATVLSLHFLPDGTLLSSGGSSPTGDPESYGKVRTWDLRGEKPTVRDEKDLSGEVHILAFARPRPGEAVKFVIGVHGARRKIQLCTVADGMIEQGHVFVGTDVLEPSGGSMLAPSTAKPPYSAAFSPDGQRVYAGAGNDLVPGTGEIRVWDIKTEEELAKKIGHHTAKISSLAVSQDGTRLVSCAQVDGPKGSSVIEIWDVDLPPERKRSPGE